MRETLLARDGSGGTMKVVTDDHGTDVLGADGKVVANHGTDRHDEMVEKYQEEGWSVAGDGAVAPAGTANAPPPDTAPAEEGGPAATVNPGTS